MNKNFELVMCLKDLDFELLPQLLNCIKSYIHPQKIIIITNQNTARHITSIASDDIEILDENKIHPKLNLDAIKEILSSRKADINRAGWYFQQFLKMAYARFVTNNNRGGNTT